MKDIDECNMSQEVHHAIVKRLYGKKQGELRRMTERKENLVGVCSKCHIERRVDTRLAKEYFWWYLESHLGYDMSWYDKLPLIIKDNLRTFGD